MIPSALLTALKEVAQHIGKKLDDVRAAVEKKETPDFNVAPLVMELRNLSAAIKSQKAPELSANVTVDTAALEEQIVSAMKGLKALSIPTTANMEASLKLVYSTLTDGFAGLQKTLAGLTSAVQKVSFTAPNTISIDKEQMRALTAGRGGSAMPMMPIATRVSNTTVAATSTGTEYNYTFPSATVGFVIKLRDQGTLAYYSWTTGKTPAGGDSSTYVTIPQNFLRSQDNVDYSGKTIYLGAESASQVFEIEVFRQ